MLLQAPLRRLPTTVHWTYLPLLRHSFVERILRVGCTEQCLDAQQDRADLKGRGPVVLQYVEADATESVDVRVIDASQEAYPRWAHGVVVREEELEVELSAYHVVSILSPVACPGSLSLLAYLRSSFHLVHPPKRRSILRSHRAAQPRCREPARSVTSPSP